MSLTKATYSLINGAPVNVLDFGAVADWNGSTGTDNLAAFNAAIAFAAAQSYRPSVYIPAGNYKLSGTLTLPTGITLIGDEVPKNYGTSPLAVSVLTCDFVGVGINTYVTPGDGSGGSAYIQVKNISINGNGQCTVGYDGGFVQNLENVNVTDCTTAGIRLNGQTTTLLNCSFNDNYDGVLIESGTTFTFTNCNMRQNTRNGVRGGDFNASLFSQCIFESNTEEGTYLIGANRNVDFQSCYWEQNDAAAGSSGYNCRIAATTFSPQINFLGCTFGSIGTTNIAYLDNCEVQFSGCSQTGEKNNTNIVTSATAKATIENSFDGFSVPVGVVPASPAPIDPDTGLYIGTNGAVGSIPATTAFGTGDFTVSFAVQVFDAASATRPICSGSAGAMLISVFGSINNARNVNIAPVGGSNFTFEVGSITGQIGVVTLVRESGVLRGYFNGKQVFSGAFTADFTQPISVIGFDNVATRLNGILYKFCAYSKALTDAEVFNLYKNGTNPVGVRTTDLVLNINTARRPTTTAYESVSGTNLTFSGTVNWLNPTS